MDVLCVGMYRACSTWQYEVAAHLVEAFHGGARLGFIQSAEYRERGGGTSAGWRVLKSHEGGPAFRRALREGHALALYAIRDPRDVVYSMLHKRGVTFDTFLRQGMIHQVLANDAYWTRVAPKRTLIQRYETIIAEPAAAVREIAAHLSISLGDAKARAIAEEYSFGANQRRATDAAARMRAHGLDPADPGNALYYDPHSLLHWNHLRDGRVGGWRERATPRESAILEHILGRWVVAHGYDFMANSELKALNPHDRVLIARGWMACRARCLALRFPSVASAVKCTLGVRPEFEAKPIAAVDARSGAGLRANATRHHAA